MVSGNGKFGRLNRKEKDLIIGKYEEHRKCCKYLDLEPMKWVEFRNNFVEDLEKRDEA